MLATALFALAMFAFASTGRAQMDAVGEMKKQGQLVKLV
jgi:hypothetical protein